MRTQSERRTWKMIGMLGVLAMAPATLGGCGAQSDDEGVTTAPSSSELAAAQKKNQERCEHRGGHGGPNGNGNLKDVAAVLDGQKYVVPCGATQTYSDLVCVTKTPENCLDGGAVFRDDTVTLAGDPATIYQVTLRVRGVVAPKRYMGGVAGSPANGTNYGLYVGGSWNAFDYYEIFSLGVSSPQQIYYLNAVDHPEQHASYPVDYTVKIPMAGGAQVRFRQTDPNCSMVRNCDETSIDGGQGTGDCHPIVIPGLKGIQQPYNGQFLVLDLVKVET